MKNQSRILLLSIALALLTLTPALLPHPSSAEDKKGILSSKEEPVDRPSIAPLRNPFLLPPGIHPLSKEDPGIARKEKPRPSIERLTEPDPTPFQVRAILISEQVRLATIGNHIVTEGDQIDGELILQIRSDRVILGRGDKKRTLYLPQSPLRPTTQDPSASSMGGTERRGADEP